MPKVPVLDNQVRNRPLPNTQLSSSYITADAYGAGMGKVIGEAGRAAAAIYNEKQEEKERARQKAEQALIKDKEIELQLWLNDRLYNPENGAFKTQGKDVLDLNDRVQSEYEKKLGELSQGLSPDARDTFSRRGRGRWVTVDGQLQRHTSDKINQYWDRQDEAYLDGLIQSGRNAYNDPNQHENDLNLGYNAIREKFGRHGYDVEGDAISPEVRQAQKEFEGTYRANVAMSMAQDDPDDALQYINQYGDLIPDGVKRDIKAKIEYRQKQFASEAYSVWAWGGDAPGVMRENQGQKAVKPKLSADEPTESQTMENPAPNIPPPYLRRPDLDQDEDIPETIKKPGKPLPATQTPDLDAALSRASQIEDKDTREETTKRVIRDYKAWRLDNIQAYQEAQELVEAGQSLAELPLDLMKSLTREQQLSLEEQDRLVMQGKQPQTDWKTYRGLMEMASNEDTEELFMNLNLAEYKGVLNAQDYKAVNSIQRSMKQGKFDVDDLTRFKTAKVVAREMFKDEVTDNDDKADAFMERLQINVNEWELSNQKKAEYEDILKIADDMVLQREHSRINPFDNDDRVYEMTLEDIGRADVARITNRLVQRGIAPTELNIKKTWILEKNNG